MKKWVILTTFSLLSCGGFFCLGSEATGADLIAQGKAEYHQNCSACHGPKDPQSRSADEWTEIINGTGCAFENVELTDAQKTSILGYLTSAAE
jgi:hypothetical protein